MTTPIISGRPAAWRQISASNTYGIKRFLPAMWFGFSAVAACISALIGFAMVRGAIGPDGWPVLLVPIFALLFGHFYFRYVLDDLADEVFDAGDSLVFRKDDTEVQIPLGDIVSIAARISYKPLRVELTFLSDTPLGRQVAFLPKRPFTLNPLASNPIVDNLIERIGRRRS